MSNEKSAEKIVMHTPGPWRIANDDETKKHLATDGYCFIEAKNGHYTEDEDTGFAITGYMGLPNAKLIVASPDLLEALQALFDAACNKLDADGFEAIRVEVDKAAEALGKVTA